MCGDLTTLFTGEQRAVAEPWEAYNELLAGDPITWVDQVDAWVVTRHDLVNEALRRPDVFSSRSTRGPRASGAISRWREELHRAAPELAARLDANIFLTPVLLNADDPDHGRRRRVINRAFTPARIRDLEPAIERIADELIAALPVGETFDFVSCFAVPLPVRAIACVLGVPEDMYPTFKQWSDDLSVFVGRTEVSQDDVLRHLKASEEFSAYFRGQLVTARRENAGSFIGDLVRAGDEAELLTESEMLVMLMELVLAGNETTTSHLTALMSTLARDPGLAQRLRDDPDHLPVVIEESLRLESPVQGFFRLVTARTTLGDVALEAGDAVLLLYGAANRDPRAWACPAHMRLDRDSASQHLAFGRGVHFCLGAALARTESRIAFQRLLGRLGAFELKAAVDELPRLPSFSFHAITSMPIACGTTSGDDTTSAPTQEEAI